MTPDSVHKTVTQCKAKAGVYFIVVSGCAGRKAASGYLGLIAMNSLTHASKGMQVRLPYMCRRWLYTLEVSSGETLKTSASVWVSGP